MTDLRANRIDALLRRLSELAAEGCPLGADEVRFQAEMLPVQQSLHASDCATNNLPAFPAWPCDCDQRDREIFRLRKSGMTYKAIAVSIGTRESSF